MMMKIKKKYTKPSTRLIELGPDVAVLLDGSMSGSGEQPTTDPSQGGGGNDPFSAKEMNFDFDFEY